MQYALRWSIICGVLEWGMSSGVYRKLYISARGGTEDYDVIAVLKDDLVGGHETVWYSSVVVLSEGATCCLFSRIRSCWIVI